MHATLQLIGKTGSLYDCATIVVNRNDNARGVQFDYNATIVEDRNDISPGVQSDYNGASKVSGNCTAFYGPNVEFSVTSDNAYPSLACVLQCNPLRFIGLPGTGRNVDATDFDDCKTKGLSEGSDSISFEPPQTCHLYDSTVKKQHSNTATGCYLPRQAKSCTLIFEGEFNLFMTPKVSGDGWHAVANMYDSVFVYNLDTSFPEDYSVFYGQNNIGQRRVYGWSYSADMNMQYGCPTKSFPLYHHNANQTVVHVSKPPVNTLCKPIAGTIINHVTAQPLGDATSLYDCARKAIDHPTARGVQWDRSSDLQKSNGRCTAFNGIDVAVNHTFENDSTFFYEDIYPTFTPSTSMACVLECNPLPFVGLPGTGRNVDATDFEDCKARGLIESSDSISFDPPSTCHLYDTTVIKQPSNTATGCYLPRQLLAR